jgi:acetoin utilization deacetylase AcuC-like enzyme
MDPLRTERVLAALEWHRLLRRRDLVEARPASLRDLLRVHSADYLRALETRDSALRAFGVPLTRQIAEAAVEAQRVMAGGTIEAARLALPHAGVSLHLGGGLHHARPRAGGGYCLINDVAVAIAHARAHGFEDRILVVDLDLHDGNGTREVFARDATVHTFSIHGTGEDEDSAVESSSFALGHGVGDERFLHVLQRELPPVMARFQPRLVFYVAGTDVAADDRLGDWLLSPRAVLERDQFVTGQVRGLAHPAGLVVVLGGGYGESAWRYTARFFLWLLAGRELPLPPSEDLVLWRLRRAGIDSSRTGSQGAAFDLAEEDLPGIQPLAASRLFLGHFTRTGAEMLLEDGGILGALRARGYVHLRVELDGAPDPGRTLRVVCEDRGFELLVEMQARRSRDAVAGMDVIAVDWLLLQDPRTPFTARRPRLPGQEHPGLGLLKDVLAVLVVVCEQMGLDGLSFRVSHFHTAALTGEALRALDPSDEACRRALRASVQDLGLAEAARAVEGGRVVDANGAPVTWTPMAMVLPVSERLKARVASEQYESRVAARQAGLTVRLRARPPASA